MGKIIGLGGLFIKAKDPKALATWYQDNLGIDFKGNTYADMPFKDENGNASLGSNVFSFFKEDSGYFKPSPKEVMINLRVQEFESFVQEIKNKGIEMIGEPMIKEYGKFAWIMDPEGNKIELWEPPVS